MSRPASRTDTDPYVGTDSGADPGPESDTQEAELDPLMLAFNNLARPPVSIISAPGSLSVNRSNFLSGPSTSSHNLMPLCSSVCRFLVHITTPADGLPILSLPSLAAKADLVIKLLLETFVNGICKNFQANPSNPLKFLLWTWCCDCPALAEAVQDSLKGLVVRQELLFVQTAYMNDNRQCDNLWAARKDWVVLQIMQ